MDFSHALNIISDQVLGKSIAITGKLILNKSEDKKKFQLLCE